MEKHLILFDIDGTLLNDDMRIPKKTVDIVSSLQKKGHLFYIASGRLLSSARSYSEMLGKNIGTIASNGSVYTIKNEIVKNRLKDEAVSAVFEACRLYPGLQLRLFSTDTAYGMGGMLQVFMNLASRTKFRKIKSKADLPPEPVHHERHSVCGRPVGSGGRKGILKGCALSLPFLIKRTQHRTDSLRTLKGSRIEGRGAKIRHQAAKHDCIRQRRKRPADAD